MINNWSDGVKAVLLDATGVLYNSGPNGGSVIPGSVAAIEKLKQHGIPFRVCSNQSTQTRKGFVEKLKKYGYNLSESDIVCPGPIIASVLKEKGLRPHLLVHPAALPEFEGLDTSDPNCIVVGDQQEHVSYQSLNNAFRVLHSLKDKKLYTYGGGKYYRRGGELVMDSGAYAAMLQHACQCEVIVCGKPQPSFFKQALDDLGFTPAQSIMIGDDIVSDIGGAQSVGLRGIQVRTGKYRPEDEQHPTVKPDGYVNNFAEAVDKLVETRFRHDSGISLDEYNDFILNIS